MKKLAFIFILFLSSCNNDGSVCGCGNPKVNEHYVKKDIGPYDESFEVFKVLDQRDGYVLLYNINKNDSAGIKLSVLKGDFKKYDGPIPTPQSEVKPDNSDYTTTLNDTLTF